MSKNHQLRLNTYSDVLSFLDAAQTWLEQDEATNNVILGNCSQLVDHPEQFAEQPLLITLTNNDLVSGVAVMTPPYGLVITGWPESELVLLIEYLSKCNRNIPSIFGPSFQLKPLIRCLQQHTNFVCSIERKNILYSCSKPKEIQSSSGFLRPANISDLATLVEWRIHFIEEINLEQPHQNIEESIIQSIEEQTVFIWQDDHPVSAVIVGRKSRHGATITFVYTPPEFRQRGYATHGVACLTRHLLSEGKQFVALFTDSSNPTSNSIYRQIGYARVTDFELWNL